MSLFEKRIHISILGLLNLDQRYTNLNLGHQSLQPCSQFLLIDKKYESGVYIHVNKQKKFPYKPPLKFQDDYTILLP